MEVVFVDGGKTAAVVLSREEGGAVKVAELGKVRTIEPHEKNGLDVSAEPAPASASSTSSTSSSSEKTPAKKTGGKGGGK